MTILVLAFLLSPALAVIEKAAGYVGFYTAEGQRAGQVKVGAFPHEAVLSSDGRLLYVTDNGVLWLTDEGDGGNTVSIVDVRGMRKTGAIDLGRFRRPHGIALDPATGRLLVTTEKPHRLLLIDPVARKVLRDYDVQGKTPHMAAFGPGGEWAFASNTDSNTVAAIHLASGKTKLIPTAARPQGCVLEPGGKRLFVADSDGNRISIIDVRELKVVGEIATGKGPGRIAITPDGKTLVYNTGMDGGVGFANVAARKQVATIPLGGRTMSLTMTPDGQRAFTGIQDQDKVFVISVSDRKVVQVIQTPKAAGPDPALPLIR
ncbi:MAG: YncE family protein [Acidobacteria bacterium]|nr:YncE family protein [Acidobacteriota bacterium]